MSITPEAHARFESAMQVIRDLRAEGQTTPAESTDTSASHAVIELFQFPYQVELSTIDRKDIAQLVQPMLAAGDGTARDLIAHLPQLHRTLDAFRRQARNILDGALLREASTDRGRLVSCIQARLQQRSPIVGVSNDDQLELQKEAHRRILEETARSEAELMRELSERPLPSDRRHIIRNIK